MGNYKKKQSKYDDERTIPLTLLTVGFIAPTAGFVGMFLNQWGVWLFGGCLVGLLIGLWLDSAMIKKYFAEKKAKKEAIAKEEARRAKIRAEKKNK